MPREIENGWMFVNCVFGPRPPQATEMRAQRRSRRLALSIVKLGSFSLFFAQLGWRQAWNSGLPPQVRERPNDDKSRGIMPKNAYQDSMYQVESCWTRGFRRSGPDLRMNPSSTTSQPQGTY